MIYNKIDIEPGSIRSMFVLRQRRNCPEVRVVH